ncbi:hypothetical protein SANA_01070 [Gottschalkiaceae bacterium SANA]|nr:hypothetical protein SANA_01070 [Gottschalkiaceae bacterium SANA]
MSAKKRSILLNKIKSEVTDFHPLLEMLFEKMYSSSKVIYNHGQQEFGADFIIHRTDPEDGTVTNIGVVAKKTKITSSALHDVTIQINTALLHSHDILELDAKISITEIIVTTIESISKHSQQVIQEAYPKTTIKFFDGKSIVRLIDKYFPNYWIGNHPIVANELTKTNTEIIQIDKSMNLAICKSIDSELYIDPTIEKTHIFDSEDTTKKGSKNKNYTHKAELVDIDKIIETEKFILIDGEMGFGKSKLLRNLCKNYSAQETYFQKSLFPIYLRYTDFLKIYNLSFTSVITDKFSDEKIAVLPSNNVFLFLIDGMDEGMENSSDQLDHLHTMLQELDSKNMKVIISTRPFHLPNKDEILHNHLVSLRIRPLKKQQLLELIKKLCENIQISDQLLDDLNNSILMKDISKSPIVGLILADLLYQINIREIPSSLTDLYTKYLEVCLGKWEGEQVISMPEYNVIDIVLQRLSTEMLDNQRSSLSYSEYVYYFKNHIEDRSYNFTGKELADKTLARSNLFYLGPDNLIYVKHRSFIDYYYAKSKIQSDNKTLPAAPKAFTNYWKSVYFFYIGLKKDCSDFLNELIEIDTKNQYGELSKCIMFSDFLLAAYDTPYKDIIKILSSIFIQYSHLYLSIRNKEYSKSIFYNLSTMQLLWFFQILARENYDYTYFNQFVEDIMLEIETSDQDEQIKTFSLFMISNIASDLLNDRPYNFLIENHNTLPDELKFALYFENKDKDKKELSKELRATLKTIRRKYTNMSAHLKRQFFSDEIAKLTFDEEIK